MTIAKKEEPKHHNPLASSTGIPTLDLIVNSNEAPTHAAVYVNDPKLSDLKMTLVQNGFHAEFAGGVLYVNSVLAIRRNEAGRFHIEGCACEDYFRIKELLYKQFAIV